MKRGTLALVLSGGGTSGVAWEAGVLKGLRDSGVDLTRPDLIVGTSAGAIVGANLTTSRDVDELYARQLLPPPAGPPRDISALMRARAALEPSGDAPSAGLNAAMLVKLGEMAASAPTESEESRLEKVRSYLPPGVEWSDRGLSITAIDIATGELVVWNKESNVSLVEAVASSCAAPMLAPPVTIGRRRYMDAGLLSGTNAQLAVGHNLVVVLAVARPGPLGPLESEIAELRTQGSRVELVISDAASAGVLFPNILDLTKRAAAAEAGRAQGVKLATLARTWIS